VPENLFFFIIFLLCPRSLGLKAAFVGESAEIEKRIIQGTAEIDILYGSPESFVGDDKFPGMF